MKRPAWLTLVLLLPLPGFAAEPDTLEIRKALDAQYTKLAEAHDRKDVKTILSLKTPDFHAIFPDGRVGDAKGMAEYTNRFLAMNEPPYGVRVTIRFLAVSDSGLIAVAEVFQQAIRMRELAGRRRKVETSVEQRETWSKTTDGWKLKCVDSVRNQRRYVDGKRVDPTKPYNPDDPPYEPEEEKSP